MKKIVSLLLVLLCSISAFSQNDAAAKKILDDVNTKVKSFKVISGTFTIKSINSKGVANGTKTGTISVKGNKYYVKQGKTEIICDGDKVYNYDGSKTITVSSATESDKILSPQKLLAGNYDKDFTYKLIATTATTYEIELKPLDAKKSFQKVNVFVNRAKGIITKARILDKSGNVLEFSFSNLDTNAKVDEKVFVFTRSKYPADAEVLD
jgi:outer membrane lipoprotein-sorting protein